jgi:hypothetical protein
MEWIETVIMEPEKMRLYFDINKSRGRFYKISILKK